MRRPLSLAFASLTLGVGTILVAAQGCNNSTAIGVQDLCGWLGNNELNCYRRFASAVVDPSKDPVTGPACGAIVTTAADGAESFTRDGVTFTGVSSPSNPSALIESNKPTRGVFVKRDKLDVCFITAKDANEVGIGGKIVFDAPLDVNAFPPAAFGFKVINPDGTECGTGSYSGAQAFSISIDGPGGVACPPEATGDGTGGAGGATTSGTTSTTTAFNTPITCGKFEIAPGDPEQTVNVTCPNDDPLRATETHHFNLFQLDRCPQYADLLPTAELKWNLGVEATLDSNGNVSKQGVPGYIKLRVFYPQAGDFKDLAKTDKAPPPTEVEYFDCTIPPPLPPCADGVKGEGETDVDCGGFLCKGCKAQQTCITQSDCDAATGCPCEPDKTGLLRCCGSQAM